MDITLLFDSIIDDRQKQSELIDQVKKDYGSLDILESALNVINKAKGSHSKIASSDMADEHALFMLVDQILQASDLEMEILARAGDLWVVSLDDPHYMDFKCADLQCKRK